MTENKKSTQNIEIEKENNTCDCNTDCKCGESCNCKKDCKCGESCNCKKDCDCENACCCGNECDCSDYESDSKCNETCCEKQEDDIRNLKAQLSEWQNRYLTAYADAENAKKRAEKDARSIIDYKMSAFAKDIIPVADNLSLAIDSIKDKVDDAVISGLNSVIDVFISALKNNGIEKIITVGTKYNPTEHRVVTQIKSDEDEGMIIKELQAGYKLGDKVIREAMVAISSKK